MRFVVLLALAATGTVSVASPTHSAGVVGAVSASAGRAAQSTTEVVYDVRVVAPEHHWMDVEIEFADLPPGPLELRMSRSSPGRYALHEFAKNVFLLRAYDEAGDPLAITRPDPYGWTVTEPSERVTVTYRIFGDRADGTYLQIDPTHAHMNGPATFVWARGLEERPIRVRLHAPTGETWTVATQLFPGASDHEFTAPNLHYLLDSPIEFGETDITAFAVEDRNGRQEIRVALHTVASDEVRQAYLHGVQAIVEEMSEVFGEYPLFDTGTYTFIADYLPWASGDGMEHRNSTILSSSATLEDAGNGLLGTVSHEFFHAWNVERIRPASLEPFDFEAANMSGELWLAEGFTSYYGNLILHRAGITPLGRLLGTLGGYVGAVRQSPGVEFRSAVEMSQLAPFVDAARPVDSTYWENTFLSYYTFGAAIGVGLDLTLRARSDGAVDLDDYMRALWVRHGRDDHAEPPRVSRPYDLADARDVLAEVSGDATFAADFFARHIEGTERIDYAPLFERAGIRLQPLGQGIAYLGITAEEATDGLVVSVATQFGSPAYAAGIDAGDTLLEVGGHPTRTLDDIPVVMRSHAPGERVSVRLRRRDGSEATTQIVLGEPTAIRLVPLESLGETPKAEQLAFREAWLSSRR